MIRKRRKPRRKNKFRFFRILLLFLILSIFIFAFTKLPIFRIKNIQVEGNSTVETETILNYSKLKAGDSLIFLNKNKIRENILENPFIEDVAIKRGLFKGLTLEIKERVAAATLQLSDKYILIDKFGVIIEESNSLMLNLAVIKGIGNDAVVTLGDKIFNYASQEQNKLLGLLFDGENIYKYKSVLLEEGQAELILKDDVVVAFGSYNNVEYKLDVLDVMIKNLEEDTNKKASMILMEDGPKPILVVE